MAGVGRPLPNELYPPSGGLRRDSQDVRRPGRTRPSSSPWVRRATKAVPRNPRRRTPQGTLGSGGRARAHPTGRPHLERHSRRCLTPLSENASGCRPRGKNERRQDDRSQQWTPAGRLRRRNRELRLLRPAHACRLGVGQAHPRFGKHTRLGQQLPRLLGEHGIDQHQLRADRPEVRCLGRLRFEQRLALGRRRLDVDWARVHRDSVTGISGGGRPCRRPIFPLLASNSRLVSHHL